MIPDKFQDLVLKMIEKRPDDRYENPRKLLSDLRQIGTYQGLNVDSL